MAPSSSTLAPALDNSTAYFGNIFSIETVMFSFLLKGKIIIFVLSRLIHNRLAINQPLRAAKQVLHLLRNLASSIPDMNKLVSSAVSNRVQLMQYR